MELKIASTLIWVAAEPVDFRKSINGLCELIICQFERKPSEGIFIFFNRERDKVKILAWHGNGFVLIYKRLERERFTKPSTEDRLYAVDAQQLSWLLAGLNWVGMSNWKQLDYKNYF